MRRLRLIGSAFLLLLFAAPASFAEEIKAAVLRIDYIKPLPISRLDILPDDLGFAGGQLATEDNQTTGEFLDQQFLLETVAVPQDEAADALEKLISDGNQIVVILANAPDLIALTDQVNDRALVMNASAKDTELRNDQCRANLLHVVPSRAMLTDAVTQFMIWKKWPKWFLIHGSHPEDKALAESYRRSAKKFGASIVEEREFEDLGGSRRTDTGHVLVQRQIPVFTRGAKSYQVVVTADEADVFAHYLPFHSWEPRPVAGSAGLRPVTWHPAHEAWGATQFQRRFERISRRYMREEDYQVWVALRVIGEAATRTGSGDWRILRNHALSPDFRLAAFMGQKLTFRQWNGQLRLPILLTDDRITVSVSPQDGYLHQRSPLDTLGTDESESTCRAFGQGDK